jgi:RNA polymerase sigma-70 factor, ECF subfamily
MLSHAALVPLFAVAVRQQAVRTPVIDSADTDAQLVKRARSGDQWAEEALYRRHVCEVTRVVLRLLGRRDEAEDVVQDAFVQALADLPGLEKPEAFRGWLMRIAVHQVHRRFRRRKLLRLLGLDRGTDDVTLAGQADRAASPEVKATLQEIDAVLSRLPSAARMAWVLRHVEGRTVDDVVDQMSSSRSTVKRLLDRADLALSAYIVEPGGEP